MEPWDIFIKKLVELMGFRDYTVEVDIAHRRGIVFLHDSPDLVKDNLPQLVEGLNHLTQLVARKYNQPSLYVDVNNYRREREDLITELVRVAARKVVATRQEIPLPAMNAYERRLAHVALATHPEVTTESFGKGKSRYVVIKPISAAVRGPQRVHTQPESGSEIA